MEFSGPNETHGVTIDVAPGSRGLNVDLECEQARSPATVGIGPDERKLGVLVSTMRFEARDFPAKPRTRARPKPMYRHSELLGDVAPEPVFVIGCYRSGTSILTWALGQHPNIYPMEETNWLPTLCHGAAAAFERASRAARSATDVYNLDLSEFLQWQGAAVDRLHRTLAAGRAHGQSLERCSQKGDFDVRFQIARSRFSPKRRWVDGTPENSGSAYLLAQMFPQAQFIHALREPAGVIASLMKFDVAGGDIHAFDEAARTWEVMNQWAYELKRFAPDRVKIARFDELTAKPAEVLSSLWRFLGEPDFHRSAETFGMRINSSGPTSTEGLDPECMARLNAIYHAMLADAPFEAVPWTISPSAAPDRARSMITNIAAATA